MNAAMISGASYARFREPTVICFRIPASTSDDIALFAAGNVRPINFAAPATETTGAPGNAFSNKSVAEFARTFPTFSRHSSSNAFA
jgi:hypothetical protein